MSRTLSRKLLLISTLVALPLLVGSQCAFFFSSGGGSSDRDKKDREDDDTIIVASGNFGDPPAEGVEYKSGSLTGSTDANGKFQYEEGGAIRFFIGDISLGQAVAGKAVITAQDLAEEGASDTAAVNISRLLQSLDSDPADDGITIPKEVRTAAVTSNAAVSSAIESMDFHDDTAFVNAASQLVAALTQDYPFTAMLVDAGDLRTYKPQASGNESQQ